MDGKIIGMSEKVKINGKEVLAKITSVLGKC